MPVSIDFKNLGALNTASWVRAMPGYLSERETTRGNSTARFDTFENGVAAWWELLRRYRENMGQTTIEQIVMTYGGDGQRAIYSTYLRDVEQTTGMPRSTEISLNNDRQLLALAKAMFAYEAGKAAYRAAAIPDSVILKGFELGRRHAGYAQGSPQSPRTPGLFGLVLSLLSVLWKLFSRK